ncbi:MAG TPA: sigma-70 family RNA polymerase sigma factor [Actinomycetota bacterium]|nr:sigma-70 family RNA polymerase sigma factor [Actinomycetota bacterium]
MEAGKQSFEQAWPDLAHRLERVLRSRHISPWLVDDIVQETGLRLFKRWDTVDPKLSPWGLALTIAKNLLWDATHRQAARELLVDVPERPGSHDVEDAGIARLELWRVARAMGRMTPRHRSVLLAEVGGAEASGPTAAATKMTRMRARKRLNALLEGASASCLATTGAMRRWAIDVQHLVRRSMPLFEGSASVTVAALVGAVVVMVPATATPSPREDRSATSDAAGSDENLLRAPFYERAATTTPNDDRTDARSPRRTDRQPSTDTTRHEVTVGNGVGGTAGVEVRRKRKSRGLFEPECSVEPREDEVYATCTIHSRDEAYIVEARVRAEVEPEE